MTTLDGQTAPVVSNNSIGVLARPIERACEMCPGLLEVEVPARSIGPRSLEHTAQTHVRVSQSC